MREKAKGCEGKKYATAVSIRAARRTIRPNESVTEWSIDSKTGECFGLPTRSTHVSEFMTGLEKMKAKAGEVSVSARALSLSDMHNLYDLCFRPNATPAEMRWGIVRYTAYLFAWLLRFEEVGRIQFESINIIPGSRTGAECCYTLWIILLGCTPPFQSGISQMLARGPRLNVWPNISTVLIECLVNVHCTTS
ncbi:hypothetical protein B0H13DRAFT_1867911 [Mycena leptocephala]|nr:hypothetical protein B0H13DRAFT_1867911 [Mycena leptocephala]